MTADLPILSIPMITVLLITLGFWSEQLGDGDLWRVPVATLVGLGLGLILGRMGIGIPALAWLVPGAVAVVGLLVAARVTEPSGIGPLVALVAGALHGRRFLTAATGTVETLATTAIAAVLTIAIGIGIAAMLGRGLSPKLVRGLGGLAAVWAVAVAFEVI